MLQPDIIHVGGIMEGKKIAAMADAYYIPVSFHNPFGPVATAAAVQLDACTTNFFMQESFCEYDVDFRFDLLEHAPRPENGHYVVPDRPGLGVGEFRPEVALRASVRARRVPAAVHRPLVGAFLEHVPDRRRASAFLGSRAELSSLARRRAAGEFPLWRRCAVAAQLSAEGLFRATRAGHRVVATVHMEAEWDPRDPVGETRWLDGLRRETGFPTAAIGQAWFGREDIAEVLAGHAQLRLHARRPAEAARRGFAR